MKARTRSLPWRQEIKVAKLLGKPYRLVDYALLLVVVAQLHETGERKVLAQRMTFETVVGEQSAHVGMTCKPHSV